MLLSKLTPVLMVESIEPSLVFWEERLGFTRTGEVPEGGKLGFVMLQKGSIEIMLQSRECIEKDIAGVAPERFECCTALYIDVEDIHALLPKLEGFPVAVPLRETFYGATEIFVREPGGHLVGFAMHKAKV